MGSISLRNRMDVQQPLRAGAFTKNDGRRASLNLPNISNLKNRRSDIRVQNDQATSCRPQCQKRKTGEPQLDHPPASRELSEEPEKEATAIRTVKGEDDLRPGAFPNDEHRVVARLSTEIADDSLSDESSLLPEQ
ncbi:hypothetical protein E4U52_003623 [Claviceps spartinae]|nr:hypothetical protein E4U52_003623 [Claviceps spartinae]